MPLAAGGGISSIQDARELIRAGADKVVVTSSAVTSPSLLAEIVDRFGSQSLVAGIDYKYEGNAAKVWIRCGSERTVYDPVEHAIFLASSGAGEIFLNCIDNDGMMEGYDLLMAKKVAAAVDIPVVVCGGAGNFMHLVELFKETQASASACASIFHFGDNNPIRARSFLRNHDVPMRVLK